MGKKHSFTDLDFDEAESLLKTVYTKTLKRDGFTIFFGDDGKKEIVLRHESKTGCPTADFYSPTSKKSKAVEKIRLAKGFNTDDLDEDLKSRKARLEREDKKAKSKSFWSLFQSNEEDSNREDEKNKGFFSGSKPFYEKDDSEKAKEKSFYSGSKPFYENEKSSKKKGKNFWSDSKPFYKK
ncbi:hypothetical protein ABRZ58_22045 [Vibrio vulnificus]|uniref:hypothetical protein n=1 Tax=Vibrio vulnificus TaxID=672 RepID=UPI0032EEE599